MTNPPPNQHDQALENAFNDQAALFERAPVQTDAAALDRLMAFAPFSPGARILDAGCGPGLVAARLLAQGLEVTGVDLSPEMIRRAEARCAEFGARARFVRGSLFEETKALAGPFDGAISRYVLHHVPDPVRFLDAQIERIAPGKWVVLSDHTTDPASDRADWHQRIECLRDVTHTRNLTLGQLADLFAARGLVEIEAREEPFVLDFDEWFDRGTPGAPKVEVRRLMLGGSGARGFRPRETENGRVAIECWRGLVRGRKPGGSGIDLKT